MSLIPPRRLGVLLQQRRRERDLTIDEIARQSGGRLLASDLDAFEHGLRPVDDAIAVEVARLYRIDSGHIVPGRAKLVIDLDEGMLFVGERTDPIPADATPQVVLGRYLALVQLLRAWKPGQPLPLRTADLAVLGESLGIDSTTVEARLVGLLESGQVDEGVSLLRRRLVIPAAGLLVGTTAAGALILVSAGGKDSPDAEEATRTAPVAAAVVEAPPAPARVAPAPAPAATDLPSRDASTGAEQVAEVPDEVPPDEPVEDVAPEVDIGVDLSVELGEAIVVTPEAEPSQLVADPVATEIGFASEAGIDYAWRDALPGWVVVYVSGTDVVTGNTNVPTRAISVSIPPGAEPTYVSEVLAHEIGHALDVTYLNDAARDRWLDARGQGGAEWWPGEGPADFDVGAGDFAEGVAAWLTGSPSNSTLAGEFSTAHLALLADLLP